MGSRNIAFSLVYLACSVTALMCISGFVACDDHIVGANHGWQVPAESGVDLNYSNWAAQQTFYLGDFISFHYQKGLHTVYEVNKTTYESCDFGNNNSSTSAGGGSIVLGEDTMALSAILTNERVVHNWSTKGGRSIVPLNESRAYYFACGLSDHCLQGMKLAIRHVLPRPPAAITNLTPPPPPSSAASFLAIFSPLALAFSFLGHLYLNQV